MTFLLYYSTIESLYEELVDEGILVRHPKIKMHEFVGDFRYARIFSYIYIYIYIYIYLYKKIYIYIYTCIRPGLGLIQVYLSGTRISNT